MDGTRQIALIAAALAALTVGGCADGAAAVDADRPGPTVTGTPGPAAAPSETVETTEPSAPVEITAASVGGSGGGGGGPATSFQVGVVSLVNQHRASAGCPAMTVDDRLTQAAQVHAQDMATRGYFDHTTPEGVTFDARITAAGYAWSRAAENIAAGQRDPAAVMAAWMDSAGHRRNILDCGLRQIGVGLAYDSRDRPIWTQEFATPRS